MVINNKIGAPGKRGVPYEISDNLFKLWISKEISNIKKIPSCESKNPYEGINNL